MIVRTMLGAAVAVALLAMPALAASQRDYDDCNKREDIERSIAGCTRIVDDRNESLNNRSRAYNNRGLVRFLTGDYDRAIADYDQAIKLDPQFAAAYYNRGLAHEDKGNRNLGIADLKRAIQLGHPLAAEELRKLGVKP